MNSKIQVGDRVRIPFGKRRVTGVVTEDRGTIGFHGRRLFQVRVSMDPFEPTVLEFPEVDIELIEEPSVTEMSQVDIKNYLINGGLVAILRANLTGGMNQPRVWLCPDSAGNVTHTFEKSRGVVGGEAIPFMALHDEKVFTPKRDEVIALLQAFGLDRQDAEEILVSVGTAP